MQIIPVDQIPLAQPVDLDNLKSLVPIIKELAELCQSEDGIGISAVQVGLPFDLFLVHFGTYHCFINTRYEPIESEGMTTSKEGCLSLKDGNDAIITYEVPRYKKIKLYGYELCSDLSLSKLNDYTVDHQVYNVVFQHEIDHSSGILISQIGKVLGATDVD